MIAVMEIILLIVLVIGLVIWMHYQVPIWISNAQTRLEMFIQTVQSRSIEWEKTPLKKRKKQLLFALLILVSLALFSSYLTYTGKFLILKNHHSHEQLRHK